MLKIKFLMRTSSACPSQWEGLTENFEPIYIRYRHGVLTMDIGKPYENKNIDDIILRDLGSDALEKGKKVYGEQIGDDYDGIMTDEEMKKHLELEYNEDICETRLY